MFCRLPKFSSNNQIFLFCQKTKMYLITTTQLSSFGAICHFLVWEHQRWNQLEFKHWEYLWEGRVEKKQIDIRKESKEIFNSGNSSDGFGKDSFGWRSRGNMRWERLAGPPPPAVGGPTTLQYKSAKRIVFLSKREKMFLHLAYFVPSHPVNMSLSAVENRFSKCIKDWICKTPGGATIIATKMK